MELQTLVRVRSCRSAHSISTPVQDCSGIPRVYICLSANTKPPVGTRRKGEKQKRCACEGVGETSGTEFLDYSGGIGGNWDNRH